MELEKREGLQGDPSPPALPPHPNMANQSLHQSRAGNKEKTNYKRQRMRGGGERRKSREGQGGLRRTTNQFVFVEKLDERGRDEGVESVQEGVYLRLDGSRHPQLCHQLDILSLREDTHT